MNEELIKAIISLVVVLGLLLLVMWWIKRMNSGLTGFGGKHIKVLDRLPLGPDKSLILVKIAGKTMLIGASAHHVEKICDVELDEETVLPEGNPSFMESFARVLKSKREGKSPFPENGDKTNDEQH